MSTAGTPNFPLGAHLAVALLKRHGIPQHKHSTTIRDVLGLSYSQAHRKINGDSPWTPEELETLGRHFGDSFTTMVLAAMEADKRVAAQMVMGKTSVEAFLWPGERATNVAEGALVAVPVNAEWLICPVNNAVRDNCYLIKRILIEPPPERLTRVAVLDDVEELATTLSASFCEAGLDSRPFFTVEALRTQIDEYDAFVLDWLVGEETAKALIDDIRKTKPEAPVAVLTGQIGTGLASESEVASLMATHKILFFEKPVRFSIINAAISQAAARK